MKIAIIWVNDYQSRHASSPTSPKCSREFASALKETPVEYAEDKAFDALFKKGAAVNNFDLVYFAGHGSDEGPIFNRLNNDDGVVAHNECDVELGGELKVAVFDCCRALRHGESWSKRFKGLRWLLGFPSDMFPTEDRGFKFAKYLLDSPPKPIDEAWKRAVLDTDPDAPSALVQAIEKEGELPEDVLMGLPPTTNPRFFVTSTELPESLSQIKLYKVQPPGWTGISLAKICERLGVPELPHESTEDFHRFGAGALDVFRVSDSIWWTKARQRRVLFGDPPVLPSPNQAIDRAMTFLREKEFVPGEFGRTWTTKTLEVHQEATGERRKELITARHVHVTYLLDGLPVMGPGAKTRVSFESEQVTAFHQFWQRPLASEDVDIIDAEDAKKILSQDEAFRQVGKYLKLDDPQLGYYALPARESPDYLLPVWAIPGRAITPPFDYRFVRYVQAVRSMPEAIRSSPFRSVFGLPKVLP